MGSDRQHTVQEPSLNEDASLLFWASLALSAVFVLTPLTFLTYTIASPQAWCDAVGFVCYEPVAYSIPLWLPGAQAATVVGAVFGARAEKRVGRSRWRLRITGLLLYPLAWATKVGVVLLL